MLKLYVKVQHLIDSMKDESGQDLVEYSLLGALIAIACIATMRNTGDLDRQTEFGKITAAL